MKKIIYIVCMLAVLTGCFFCTAKTAQAKENATTQTISVSSGNVILNSDVPAEVKEPIEKGKSLVTYVVRVAGWLMVVFGFVFLGISFFSHQTDQRIMGAIALGVGFLVAFSPEIANWITGK